VPTADVAREVAAFLPAVARKLVVAPNAPGRAWREAPRCEGPGRHFAIVGIAERRKRLDVVVEAVRRARRRGPVLPVVAVGRAPEHWAFDAVPGGAGRHVEGFAFAGSASDAESLRIVRDAAALLHPSRYEGFGLPLLEAFACGVPVLATRGAAVEEVAGDLATWVEDDPDAWAAALLELSAEPWARLAGRDERRARAASFAWDAAAAAVLAHRKSA
jgi:glycosyltransferase involved in cell wall biosynthesis